MVFLRGKRWHHLRGGRPARTAAHRDAPPTSRGLRHWPVLTPLLDTTRLPSVAKMSDVTNVKLLLSVLCVYENKCYYATILGDNCQWLKRRWNNVQRIGCVSWAFSSPKGILRAQIHDPQSLPCLCKLERSGEKNFISVLSLSRTRTTVSPPPQVAVISIKPCFSR